MPVFLSIGDIAAQLDHVDDPDVLQQAEKNPALERALEMSRPENWWGTGLRPEELLPIAEGEGIPTAWVPPPTVLQALVAAPRSERLAVLNSFQGTIIRQCEFLIDQCGDPPLSDNRVLLGRALAAFEAGYHEAAMALAVAVGESLALWACKLRGGIFASESARKTWEEARKKHPYSLARHEVAAVGPSQLKGFEVLRRALIGPIPRFFSPFYPSKDMPIPDTVSRHMTVHQPTVEHLSKTNALLAIMLSTSLLRERQFWNEDTRIPDVGWGGD